MGAGRQAGARLVLSRPAKQAGQVIEVHPLDAGWIEIGGRVTLDEIRAIHV